MIIAFLDFWEGRRKIFCLSLTASTEYGIFITVKVLHYQGKGHYVFLNASAFIFFKIVTMTRMKNIMMDEMLMILGLQACSQRPKDCGNCPWRGAGIGCASRLMLEAADKLKVLCKIDEGSLEALKVQVSCEEN